MTGMTMAMRKPSVLRTLVLCDTTSEDPLGDPALWQQRIDAVRTAGSMDALVESTLARLLTPETVKTRPELVILKHAAHLSNLEQADAFNEAVLGCLARH